jgi:hypothetical protein
MEGIVIIRMDRKAFQTYRLGRLVASVLIPIGWGVYILVARGSAIFLTIMVAASVAFGVSALVIRPRDRG